MDEESHPAISFLHARDAARIPIISARSSINRSNRRRLFLAADSGSVPRSIFSNQESYSAANVRSGVGRAPSIHAAAESDHRIIHGAMRVVIADTVTAIGYRKSRVAPVEMPSPAMMKW